LHLDADNLDPDNKGSSRAEDCVFKAFDDVFALFEKIR
jgi:hypothetical protein